MDQHTSADEPGLGLEQLTPPHGGIERLLAKRAQRSRQVRFVDLLPAVACAASILVLMSALRAPTLDAPTLDVDEVRRQLTARGTTLQLTGKTDAVVERRAVANGVHIYAVQRR